MSEITEDALSHRQHFSYRGGYMYCEGVQVKALQEQLQTLIPHASPFFLFSESQIRQNVLAYKIPLQQLGFPYMLGFAVKANYNPHILQLMHEMECTAVTVSGNEIRLALRLGIPAHNIIYNGNGKLAADVQLAVAQNCLINVDSSFDLQLTVEVARKLGHSARVLLRVNPNIQTNVHHHLATGVSGSKFGIEENQLASLLQEVRNACDVINLVGLHCHLGSTIDNVQVFRRCLKVMLDLTDKVNSMPGLGPLTYLNLGGGLGINYKSAMSMPKAKDLVGVISEMMTGRTLTLILEPGRSLIGNTAILVTKVLGTKTNGQTKYVVVDGSMTEVIRPCMYDAYHHIALTEPSDTPDQRGVYDIVGPVCESADFLGKKRELQQPHPGCGMAVFDVGAYCSSMASNYNLRLKPAEVLVCETSWKVIRQPDTLEDILKPYAV